MTEHVRAHLGFSKEKARERAIEMLTAVRIPDPESALYAHPHQFSGGMRQRIAIAMALACEPRLLVADEPTTALDVTVQAGILRLLDRLRRERGVSVMIITHDLGVLSSISDRICILYGGRVAEYGVTPDVLGAPRHPYTEGLMRSLPGASASGCRHGAHPGVAPEPRRHARRLRLPPALRMGDRDAAARSSPRCAPSTTAGDWRATSTPCGGAPDGRARLHRWAGS